MKRASDCARDSMMDRPSLMSPPRRPAPTAGVETLPAPAAAQRLSRVRRLAAMDWIGASELLISCDSTRIKRSHASRSSPRSVRVKIGEEHQLVRTAVLDVRSRGAAPSAR